MGTPPIVYLVLSQAEATAYCEALALHGIDDWRLPSLNEMATLYDFKSIKYPPMDLVAFPADGASVGDVNFWSAGGWRFSFWDLTIRHQGTATARARCVH